MEAGAGAEEGGGAERAEALLAQGIERYAAGDLRASAALFREAVAHSPGDERVRAYAAWTESRLAAESPGEIAAEPPPASDAGRWLDDEETRERDPEQVLGSPISPRRLALGVPADESFDLVREITLPWHPSVDSSRVGAEPGSPVTFHGVEAPVRHFLSRTPTRPNLPPLEDVHILDDARVEALAGLHGDPNATAPYVIPRSSLRDEVEASPPPVTVAHDTLVEDRPLPAPEPPPVAPAVAAPGEPEALPPLPVDAAGSTGGASVAELGDRSRTIRAGVVPDDLDPRSAFLLSRVDGTFSIDDLLDICGMDREGAVQIIARLLRIGALVPG